jgi:hypothetical protein
MRLCRHCTLAFTAGKRTRADFGALDFGDNDHEEDDDTVGADAGAAVHHDAAAAHHTDAEKLEAENVYRELNNDWERAFDESMEGEEQRLGQNITEMERALRIKYGEDFIRELNRRIIDEKHPS